VGLSQYSSLSDIASTTASDEGGPRQRDAPEYEARHICWVQRSDDWRTSQLAEGTTQFRLIGSCGATDRQSPDYEPAKSVLHSVNALQKLIGRPLSFQMALTPTRSLLNALRSHTGWRSATMIKIFMFPMIILANPQRQRNVSAILKMPNFSVIASLQPRFPFKYLNNRYLAGQLTTSKRALALIHHYRYLDAKACDCFLREMLRDGITAYKTIVKTNVYTIMMGLSAPITDEGELSLELRLDGITIFILSFTIVPGAVIDMDAKDVILITRIQGVRGSFKPIQMATKDLNEISPPALLFSAVHGAALAFNIDYIAGVAGVNQPAYSESDAGEFYSAYDEFFVSLGGVGNASGFFYFPVPLREKPLAFVKRDHRSRTRRKRLLKSTVSESVRQVLQQNCRSATASPARA
jgi:uncharacterized protein VirK/YbjX